VTLTWRSRTYDTDKYPELVNAYESFLAPVREDPVVLLELGVADGGSLLLWRDYFPRGLIVGLDARPVSVEDPSGRVRVYQGLQEDLRFLDRIALEVAPDGFSVIIDDASHVGELARISFWHLFPRHLRPGGIYAIEDWGTGYWESWPDGQRWQPPSDFPLSGAAPRAPSRAPAPRQFPSHQYGMVGFVKELIDEVGADDATREGPDGTPMRRSLIAALHMLPALAVVVKSRKAPPVRRAHGRPV